MDYYGVREIADALGEDPRVVSNWWRRGKLPEPSARLYMGPMWTAAAIRPWIRKRKRAQKKVATPPRIT